MEITKVVKPFIRRGANTFGNIVYIITYSWHEHLLGLNFNLWFFF